MLKKTILLLFLPILLCSVVQITTHNYGLNPLNDIAVYKKQVEADPNQKLINLEEFIPKLKLDIKYATKDNFVGEPVYNLAKAFSRKPVAFALKQANEEFKKLGFGIKVFDAYRPYSITVKFYEIYKDTTYVASPYSGSRHNRGAAIDLTLFDIKTGLDINMGTNYDDFSEKAHPSYQELPSSILKSRDVLISVMKKNGFNVYHSEWWHFDFKGWEKFKLLDISFEDLAKKD